MNLWTMVMTLIAPTPRSGSYEALKTRLEAIDTEIASLLQDLSDRQVLHQQRISGLESELLQLEYAIQEGAVMAERAQELRDGLKELRQTL